MRLFLIFSFILTVLMTGPILAMSTEKRPLNLIKNYKKFFSNTCSDFHEKLVLPNNFKGWMLESQTSNKASFFNPTSNQKVAIISVKRKSAWSSLRYTFYKGSNPELFLSTSNACEIGIARLIRRDSNQRIHSISTLSKDLEKEKVIELMNPAVPPVEPVMRLKIALIDTGINYVLPEITKNIARKSPTQLLGHDFEDGDQLPFDIDFVGSPFFPRHHGTSVASILIREAPFVQIVPYRFSRKNPCLFKNIVTEIAKLNIKVALVPMGSGNFDTWKCFDEAVRKHREILFIVSAGNSNQNIDIKKVYPASLSSENILVISSSTIFGDLAKGSNFGAKNVDLLVPAEQIRVIDHRGVKSIASGSSFAVPRVGAMVARFLDQNRGSTIADIKRLLIKRAVPVESNSVKLGWIPDPLDDYLF